MLTSDFDYNLPEDRIAQFPIEPRDSSKLMVVDRKMHDVQHRTFHDIVDYLSEGDLLVWNNSKVFKARLFGSVVLDSVVAPTPPVPTKVGTTSPRAGEDNERPILGMPKIEVFLVRPTENVYVWKVLAKPGKKLRLGMKVRFAPDFEGEVLLKEADGTILMQFAEDDVAVRAKANQYGEVPTPPYVNLRSGGVVPTQVGTEVGSQPSTNPPLPRPSGDLSERYQTVYAKKEGSVAAPTAGFHFTPELIEKLEKKGVQFAEVTLHVGLGTFLPVKSDKIEDHHMHSEFVEVTAKNADLINQAKAEGRRVIAVGTTTVRTLEGVWRRCHSEQSEESKGQSLRSLTPKGVQDDRWLEPFSGDVNIFISPGFKFNVIDAMITNFHLPKSTLLMLVSAFVGDREFTLECYWKAIEEKYRFYSFGDAMLIK